ncbi:MAG: hypothetical protein Alpg2KO_11040 [Alphaproteobacteria bacterium]
MTVPQTNKLDTSEMTQIEKTLARGADISLIKTSYTSSCKTFPYTDPFKLDLRLFPDLVLAECGTPLPRPLLENFVRIVWKSRKLTLPPAVAKLVPAFTKKSFQDLALASASAYLDGDYQVAATCGGMYYDELQKLDQFQQAAKTSAEADLVARACYLDWWCFDSGEDDDANKQLIPEDSTQEDWAEALSAIKQSFAFRWHNASQAPGSESTGSHQSFDMSEIHDVLVERSKIRWKRGVSEAADKGLLAFWSAYPDKRAIPLIEKRLQKITSTEFNFGKDLLTMLEMMDLDAGIQLIVRAAQGHRMAGLRKHALKLMDKIADRRNWTVEQLRDRAIPDFGLNSSGRGQLDYGSRKIQIVLTDALELMAEGPNSKRAKTAPKALKNDDQELAAEERKRFTGMKRELKKALTQQEQCLLQDMTTQRQWNSTEWQSNLAAHPLMSRLCQRLVWLRWKDSKTGQPAGSFRLSEDGSLITSAGDEMELLKTDSVSLAHYRLLNDNEAAEWLDHIDDFEITPWFNQLTGTRCQALEAGQTKSNMHSDLNERTTTNLKLRKWSAAHQFQRGEIGDGGSFTSYTRDFPHHNCTAILEFNGDEAIGLRDENPLQLLHLKLVSTESKAPVPLEQLSPILLDYLQQAIDVLE